MATDKSSNVFQFEGFDLPTTTPVPDQVFDELLHRLTDPELRVLLYIIRRTLGFKKQSDDISLKQMVEGITTKDGRVLDYGTGASKPTVTKAIKGLVQKGIVVAVGHKSPERGYEPTTYTLRFRGTPMLNSLTWGSKPDLQGHVNGLNTQQTVLQETVKQHDVVVEQALQNFGISKSSATKLTRAYPERHILDKLELAQWLVSTRSPLVAQNPTGWLRKAIIEDYAPPRNYQSSRQRKAKGEKATKIPQAEARERRMAEEEYLRVKAEAKAQLLEQYPPQPIGKEGLTTESVWNLTLKQLKEQIPSATYETRLKDTVLLQVTDLVARIAVPSAFAGVWLERRMYRQIYNAMKGVLGKDLDLQFVTSPLAMGLTEVPCAT